MRNKNYQPRKRAKGSGLKSRIFITAGERSVACGLCESAELARMGKTPQSLLFCPFGQGVVVRFVVRRQRYARLRL
ncbi:MAG: hypothetical protein LBG92_04685 [Prevotellaceae bacterium]|nr:hypothetical protein [Prevotellaceae bacterium]